MAVQDDHMIRNIQDVGRLIAKLLLHEQQPNYKLPEKEADYTEADRLFATIMKLAEEGKTPLLFAKDGVLQGMIAVADVMKEDSAEAIRELKEMGIRVVMLTGDGSFHMNLNEACTAVSYELPIITVIFNNQVLGMVRQWQTAFYGKRFSQTDPHRKTNFVKLAEGFGAKGYRAETPAEFKAAFADAMKQKGPSWIDCRIGKDEKVLPMIPGGGSINDIIME